jgi:hypothetical protein
MKKGTIITAVLIFTAILTMSCAKKDTDMSDSDSSSETSRNDMDDTVSYAGYLVDVTCGTMGKGMDGANLATNPEDHTLHCLEVCAASGFGVMTYNEDVETYYFIPFDDSGNEDALAVMNSMTEDMAIPITVTGVLNDGILSVTELKTM